MSTEPTIINNEEKKVDEIGELKELLAQNLALTQEIHEMTHNIKSYITFQKVMSFVYFLLIVVPIIISLIYLPPLIQGMMGQYSSVLGGDQSAIFENLLKTQSGRTDLNGLTTQIQGMLK